MDLKAFRAQYPMYDDLPDDVLAAKLGQRFGAEGPQQQGFLAGLGRNLRQGGTFGWGDEAVGALGALGAGAPGTEAYGAAYDRIRKREDELAGQFSQQNPMTGLAANVAGGIATGGALGKAVQLPGMLSQAAQALPAWARAAGGGAAGGALAGAGENEENRTGGAAMGAAFGTGAGALTHLAAKYGGKAVEWMKRKVLSGPGKRGAQEVYEALQREGMDPQQAEAAVRAMGGDTVLADLGGQPRNLAVGAAAVPGAPRGQYDAFLRQRHAGQQGQLLETLEAATGRQGETLSYQRALEASRKQATKPLYEQAYATPTPVTDVLSDALTLPEVQRAYKNGHRIAQLEDGRKLPLTSWDDKAQEWVNPPTTMEWDWINRGLRQSQDQARRAGKMDAARAIGGLRTKILGEIDAANPAFAQARQLHATGKQIEESLEMGKGFFAKQDPELLRDSWAQMNLPERGAYLEGVVKAIRERIRGVGENRDISVQQWLRTPEFQDRIRELFGPQAAADVFKQLDTLGEKAITKNQMLHQSMTADKTAIRETLEGADMGDVARQTLQGNPLGALDAMRRAVTGKVTTDPDLAAEILRLLMTPAGSWQQPLAQTLRRGQMSPGWQRRAAGQYPGMLPFSVGGQAGMGVQ